MGSVGTIPPGSGDSSAGPAKGGKGGKAKGKGGKGRKKKKQKDKMKCGESGKYGDLKKKTGDNKFDRDHVPSKASLKERARNLNDGDKLCAKQAQAVDNVANAIAIPKWAHSYFSPTYGSRNTPDRIRQDARAPQAAAKRDTAAMKKAMKDKGASKECQKAYAKWANKINNITPKQYDQMLRKAVGK